MRRKVWGAGAVGLLALLRAGASGAQDTADTGVLGESVSPRELARAHGVDALSTVPVPKPSNWGEFVRDDDAAIALGKALFWDMQIGSDGQACASCHFHAGADPRAKNQLNPGLLRVDDPTRDPDPDLTFGGADGRTASGGIAGPNYELLAEDFPFHRLEDPEDRESCRNGQDDDGDGVSDLDDADCFDTNDVASSQGTFAGGFIGVPRGRERGGLFDVCAPPDDALFQADGIVVRKVEPRNTPTTINAVFNHRNFWDGRASDLFNALNPLGERGLLPTADNPNPGTLQVGDDGVVRKVQVRIDNASLASQAVGPPLSDFEMSCDQRTNADLGRKLRTRQPLAFQRVHAEDGVLGALRGARGFGLRGTYQALIQRAFREEWWAGEGRFDPNGDPATGRTGYTQLEVNFPLFFGLAIQAYEATLVSDDTPFDRYMAGDDEALDEVEKFGLEVFLDAGKCVNCHSGPELTGAAVSQRARQPFGNEEAIERMVMDDGGAALYDGGFYNIGVRPTLNDLGVGADLAGFPLSFARQAGTGNVIDAFAFDSDRFEVPGLIEQDERVAVDGAFKTPSLRNVALTGPYFHNGGTATLAQVVAFYDRGGDRVSQGCGDTSGFADACSNLDPDIVPLGLGRLSRDIGGETVTGDVALVRFMRALTDDRVRHRRAPFDHPELIVPNGHPGDSTEITALTRGRAADALLRIRAVGRNGSNEPLEPFLGLDPARE